MALCKYYYITAVLCSVVLSVTINYQKFEKWFDWSEVIYCKRKKLLDNNVLNMFSVLHLSFSMKYQLEYEY